MKDVKPMSLFLIARLNLLSYLRGMRKVNRKLRPSIKKDVIHPSDYLNYKFLTACEDCTHFHLVDRTCTFGYNTAHHLRETQTKSYELSGKMALCRFMEID